MAPLPSAILRHPPPPCTTVSPLAQPSPSVAGSERPLSLAPQYLEKIMGVVYPLSLGLDEGCAQAPLPPS